MNINKLFLVILLLSCLMTVSCQQNSSSTLFESYIVDTIKVNPDINDDAIDSTKYIVDKVIPLDLPEEYKLISCAQMICNDDKIYILDEKNYHTIFVFDLDGHFLYKLGERGHAKNEYINGPCNFSVDKKNNNVLIHELGQISKIFRYDKNGKFIDAKMIEGCGPRNVSYWGNGNYIVDFPNITPDNDSQLAIMDSTMKITKSIIPLTRDKWLGKFDKSFYKSDYLYYHPLFSDSILVFDDEKIVKVKKIDFNGRFIPEKNIEQAYDLESFDPIYSFKGAQFIDRYEETKDLIYMKYANQTFAFTFYKNKRTGKTYNVSPPLFVGMFPDCYTTLCNDKILYFVGSDENEIVCNLKGRERIWKACCHITPNAFKNIFFSEKFTPTVVFVKLK